MPKKTRTGVLRRAAQNPDRQFAGGNRAATVRESVPARVPGIDKGKLRIAPDFDKMSKSELADWYGPSRHPK
jgi:hypothetical protein